MKRTLAIALSILVVALVAVALAPAGSTEAGPSFVTVGETYAFLGLYDVTAKVLAIDEGWVLVEDEEYCSDFGAGDQCWLNLQALEAVGSAH